MMRLKYEFTVEEMYVPEIIKQRSYFKLNESNFRNSNRKSEVFFRELEAEIAFVPRNEKCSLHEPRFTCLNFLKPFLSLIMI